MTRVNSNYQRLCFGFNKSGNAHTSEMCTIMHWSFCSSSNSPGKFNSSTGAAVRHCEAPASSRVQALWNSWEDTQLTCAGRCIAIIFGTRGNNNESRTAVCPYKHPFTGVCWFAPREPPGATLKRRVPKGQSLAHAGNRTDLLSTDGEGQSTGAAQRTAR